MLEVEARKRRASAGDPPERCSPLLKRERRDRSQNTAAAVVDTPTKPTLHLYLWENERVSNKYPVERQQPNGLRKRGTGTPPPPASMARKPPLQPRTRDTRRTTARKLRKNLRATLLTGYAERKVSVSHTHLRTHHSVKGSIFFIQTERREDATAAEQSGQPLECARHQMIVSC